MFYNKVFVRHVQKREYFVTQSVITMEYSTITGTEIYRETGMDSGM